MQHRCTLVDFRNNGIGIMGITALCAALKNNEVLATLILGSNSVGDEGAELLSRFMAGALNHIISG